VSNNTPLIRTLALRLPPSARPEVRWPFSAPIEGDPNGGQMARKEKEELHPRDSRAPRGPHPAHHRSHPAQFTTRTAGAVSQTQAAFPPNGALTRTNRPRAIARRGLLLRQAPRRATVPPTRSGMRKRARTGRGGACGRGVRSGPSVQLLALRCFVARGRRRPLLIPPPPDYFPSAGGRAGWLGWG
jgi:hypothetical protein